jgi:hypothetical protein
MDRPYSMRRLVIFMVRWAVAAIPALIVLALIAVALAVLFG